MRVRRLVSLAVATLALVGCDHIDDRQPVIQRWGGAVSDLRYQWGADPGIDLLTGPAVPVRAYIESRALGQYMGSIDYAYPGFTRAVPATAAGDGAASSARDLRPNIEYPLKSPLIGNDHFYILSLSRAGGTVAATLCRYTYAVAKLQDSGMYSSVARTLAGEPRGIEVSRVILAAADGEPASTLPPQAGPSPSPAGDVFGDWQITGYLAYFSTNDPGFKSLWPTYDADIDACVDKAPDPPDRRAFLINGEHPLSEFPTSPANPGWPEGKG